MTRTIAVILLSGLVSVFAGCGGGGSSFSGESTTTEAVDTGTTTTEDAYGDTAMSTDTTATGAAVNAGEPATWRGDAFTVSGVGTSDAAPVVDFNGEQPEAENGTWLSFKVTPADDNSGVWGSEFAENMQIKGGDGAVYASDLHNNGADQEWADEGDFLVWIDLPEAALSGAVLEIGDGLHTVDPDPGDYMADPVPDPAYATRVNLGL